MKKLLNTLYVTTQGAYLHQEGETVVASVDHADVLRLPIHTLAGIVCFGQVSCSPPLLGGFLNQAHGPICAPEQRREEPPTGGHGCCLLGLPQRHPCPAAPLAKAPRWG